MAVTQDTIRKLTREVEEASARLKWFEDRISDYSSMEKIEKEVFSEEFSVVKAEYMRASRDLQIAISNYALRK